MAGIALDQLLQRPDSVSGYAIAQVPGVGEELLVVTVSWDTSYKDLPSDITLAQVWVWEV